MSKTIRLAVAAALVLGLSAPAAPAQWGAVSRWGQTQAHGQKDKCPKGVQARDYCERGGR